MSVYETHNPNKGKGDYLKLKDGEKVKLRFASEPAIVTYDGRKIRYQWIVFNRNEKKAQVYEAGAQVFGQLASLFPEWGDPTTFDVTISREGSGQFDTSYTVTPSPKSTDLTEDETTLVVAVAEKFPGAKSKLLSEYEDDGILPQKIMDKDDDVSEEDIPFDR